MKYQIKCADPEQHSMFYSDCEPALRNACVGHLRMDSRSCVYVRGQLRSAAEFQRYARTNSCAGQIEADRLCRQDQQFHNGRDRPRAENQRRFKFKI